MISIIIPVYNVENYLEECLDSVVSQSFDDLEIILVDDGSTDKSGKICDNYALKDNRIRVIHKQNEGVSVTRNVGLDNAHGNWIMFIDADDFLFQNSVKILYETAERDGSDIVFGNAKRLIGNNQYPIFSLKNKKTDKVLKSLPSRALWGYLMKREPLSDNAIKFVEGLAYSEDVVFLDEAALFYKQLSIIDKFIYVYRDNPFSVCKSTKYLRKIRHQFWAASLILNLRDKYKSRNPIESELIYKDGLLKIRVGINVAVTSNISNIYEQARGLFYEYFANKYKYYFICSYFCIYILDKLKNLKRILYK